VQRGVAVKESNRFDLIRMASNKDNNKGSKLKDNNMRNVHKANPQKNRKIKKIKTTTKTKQNNNNNRV